MKTKNLAEKKIPTGELKPPQATQKPYAHTKFEDRREDPYFWMRDRENPLVLKHLKAENAYTKTVLADQDHLQKKIFQELKSRIAPDDASSPVRQGKYFYSWKYKAGKEHPILIRKTSLSAKKEEVLLDENVLAKGKKFFQLGAAEVSPDGQKLAYTYDTQGRRLFSLAVKDLSTGKTKDLGLKNISGQVVWANDNATLFYVGKDTQTLRADHVFRRTLNEKISRLVTIEKDPEFQIGIGKSISGKYIFLSSEATLTQEYSLIPADRPTESPIMFEPREKGHDYNLEHAHGQFYIRTNWNAPNYRMMVATENNFPRKNWRQILAASEKVLLENFLVIRPALVIEKRELGLLSLVVYKLDSQGQQIDQGQSIPAQDQAYSMSLGANREFETDRFRYQYESPIRPPSAFDFVLADGKPILIKEKKIPNYKSEKYQVLRKFYPARDGTMVPVTLISQKEKPDKMPALLVYGYGSYGLSMDPDFGSKIWSLVDRGFVFAIAHIRGGQELGRAWYDGGKLLNKKNTFYDFIDVTQRLVEDNQGDPNRVYAMGGSAGGLLMGVVANMSGQSYKGMVAQVPFVDNLTTMLDDTIPLTTGEYNEWGNPNEEKFYRYIKSYSVYDNIERKPYPAMLITTGFHDSQVQYWEPMKWVARLREMKTDQNPLLFHTTLDAGHGGSSGRYEALKDAALTYTFLLWLDGQGLPQKNQGKKPRLAQPAE